MHTAVMNRLAEATIVVKAAAVSDYRPKHRAPQKMKRNGALTLELEPTEDILAEVARHRREGAFVVGFAAETENVLENARGKLVRKGVDAILVNDVSHAGTGFDSERNAATLLTATEAIEFAEMPKREMAGRLLDEVVRLRRVAKVAVVRR
jgi:phosphopantothenoylcysteine decarboxylase/phosphopantothenate--cysteine ligase